MSLRLAHIADLHADEGNRLEDLADLLRTFVARAQAAKVDLILIPGDLYERRSSPAERNVISAFLVEAANVAPVFICKGNHDVEGDLDILGRLEGGHPIIVENAATAAPGSAHEIQVPCGNFKTVTLGLLAMSWFDKSHLVAQLPPDVPADQTNELCIQLARQMLSLIRAEASRIAADDGIPIFIAHPMVCGSEVSTGQTMIGQTVELAPGDLRDVGAAYTALGHVHKHQAWGNVVYAGSPKRNNHGEMEAKGWVLVEIDPDRWREPGGVTWTFQELPARAIVHIEDDYTEDPANPVRVEEPQGPIARSLVRYRYAIKADDKHLVDEDAIRQRYYDQGAKDVKVDPRVIHPVRMRAPEIVVATDTWSKLVALWKAKGEEISDEEKDRLRLKIAELETTIRAEAAA